MPSATARIAVTAIILACGAKDDEVNAVADRLFEQEVPEDREQVITQVRNAIREVRKFRGSLGG